MYSMDYVIFVYAWLMLFQVISASVSFYCDYHTMDTSQPFAAVTAGVIRHHLAGIPFVLTVMALAIPPMIVLNPCTIVLYRQHLARSCSFSCHRPVSPHASPVVDLEEDLAMSDDYVENSPAVNLESNSPHPRPFRPLVVDPESVLAENSVQDHPTEELESEETENDQATVVETQQLDVDTTGPRILDSQGLLVSSVSSPPSDQPIPHVELRVKSAEPRVESVTDEGTPPPPAPSVSANVSES